MVCWMLEDNRKHMFNELREIDDAHESVVLDDTHDLYKVLMGKHPKGVLFE